MGAVAYELRDGLDLDDFGGSVSVGGKTVNVGERLKDGGGYIVTSDPFTQQALDGYPSLKRASVEDAGAATDVEAEEAKEAGLSLASSVGNPLEGVSKDELEAEAKARGLLDGITGTGSSGRVTKDDLFQALTLDDNTRRDENRPTGLGAGTQEFGTEHTDDGEEK